MTNQDLESKNPTETKETKRNKPTEAKLNKRKNPHMK